MPSNTNVLLISIIQKDSIGNLFRSSASGLKIEYENGLPLNRSQQGKFYCHLPISQKQITIVVTDSSGLLSRVHISFQAQSKIVPPNCGMYFAVSDISAKLKENSLLDSLKVVNHRILPKDTSSHLLLFMK